jgi:chemotaxis protein methyltransferase CheR
METDLYHQVKRAIWDMLHIDLDCYRDEHMHYRLDTWLLQSGARDWYEYFFRLHGDSLELARFRDYLTVNVSSFFRDQDRWECLRELLAVERVAGPGTCREDGMKIWSAGCSIGAEPYSLAILLEELSRWGSYHILATDLNRSALSKSTCRGPYNAEEVRNIPVPHRNVYLEQGGPPFFVQAPLARNVEFREHNLLEDPFPEEMDLIVCRNVAIYFTEQTQMRIYQEFYHSLRPEGILFIGETERIPQFREIGFKRISPSFYQKN